MKTSVFFLEDSESRYSRFYKWIETKIKNPEIVSAIDSSTAIEILKQRKHFDIIFLDHDLGGKIFVDSKNENTGYQVAKFMKRNKNTFNQLIVHSQNPVGAENIKSIFSEAILMPFPELIRQ